MRLCYSRPATLVALLVQPLCTVAAVAGAAQLIQPAPVDAKNVLLIIVDDLRPEAAYYNESSMITPNIDKLGRSGLVFNRCFCQQAICGPTRNSFLSGRRPQRTKSWNFKNSFRDPGAGPNWVSFPQYFKENGYTTLGTGKTFHPNLPPNWDLPHSWSNFGDCTHARHNGCQSPVPIPPSQSNRSYVFAPNGYPRCTQPEALSEGWINNSYVCPDRAPIASFGDTIDTQATLNDMEYASKLGKPFFLACGIHRPHLPWHMPREFWDMYPPTEEIELPKHQQAPTNMPPIAFTYECDGQTRLVAFNETCPIPFPNQTTCAAAGTACDGVGSTTPPPNITRSLRKGYYASVTYTDHLVGMLLDKLEDLKHEDDTVVALIGDHGWQLGEHNIWGKHTNFELGTRVPMILRAPHLRAALVSDLLVESVDLYPTVAALAGLSAPPDLDGVDLSPLFHDPNPAVPPKPNIAFSEYPRCAMPDAPWDDRTSCVSTPREKFTVMGLSVRVPEWRYTAWMWWDGSKLKSDFSRAPAGVELYAHKGDTEADFDLFENENVAAEPQNKEVLAQLHAMAVKQWS